MSAPSEVPAGSRESRRRRLVLRSTVVLASVLVVFALVVFVLPTPLARYVIASQLESIGVQHDGIDTIDVDLWNSRVRAGPIRFHSGETPDGRIGATGFDYSFGAVFRGRAFIRTFHLSGVDVRIVRRGDGSISINGVDLSPKSDDRAKAEEDEGGSSGGGIPFGVSRFEFTASTLVFEDVTGGTLTMDVDRLSLERLFTWAPEEPAAFELEGRLNDVELSLNGTLLPLEDPIRLTMNGRIGGITIERVARFVGATGLARQDGRLDADVSSDYAIHRDGRVSGTVNGSYVFTGFDVATETGERFTLDKATVKVGLKQELRPDDSATIGGTLSFDAAKIGISNAAGAKGAIGSLDVAFEDLELEKSAARRKPRFVLAPPAETAPGTARSIIELMVGWARELGRNALAHQLSFTGRPRLTVNDVRLDDPPIGGAPGGSVTLGRMTADLGDVDGKAFDSGWSGRLGLRSAIDRLEVRAGTDEDRTAVHAVRIDAGKIDLSTTDKETSVSLDLKTVLRQISGTAADGGAISLGAVTLESDGFRIRQGEGGDEAAGPLAIRLEGLEGRMPGEHGTLSFEGKSVGLALAPFSLKDRQSATVDTSGTLEAASLAVKREGASPLSITLASHRSVFTGVRIVPLGPQRTAEGAIETSLSDLALEIGAGAEAVTVNLRSLTDKAAQFQATGLQGDAPRVSLASRLGLEGLKASLPVGNGKRAEAALHSLSANLSNLTASGSTTSAKAEIDLSRFTMKATGGPERRLDIASISIKGADVASDGMLAADSIALGETRARIALGDTGESGEKQSKPAKKGTGSGLDLGRPIRLGRFTIAPGSGIDVADATTDPPLKANVRIDELRLGAFDSAKPNTRTNLSLAATVNERAKAALSGWAAPFKAKPDFELAANVDDLALPFLSPYIAKAAGVDIESGELTATAAATAKEGGLAGKIDLRLADLFVVPISKEQAERIKANIGLPVGFAVGLLKDGKGRIKLGLPIGGSVQSPQIDYSEAIGKAVTGALASVFPTNWFGKDRNSFEIQPAAFVPGTTELTESGKDVVDHMGRLFAQKSGIRMRACGRAARDDLIALRGGPEKTAPAPKTTPAPEKPPAAPEKISRPDKREVEELLTLAKERGTVVRQYLAQNHQIDPERVPECRTAYSIQDGKPPRAEFQF